MSELMNDTEREEGFMRRAVGLAVENIAAGRGGPFGALVVRGGTIVAEGTNLVTTLNDPTAHAEITAIRRACEALGSHDLSGCEIYSSCEPCPMCMGAIYWARPERVYFACTRADAAAAGFDDSMIYDQLLLSPEERSVVMRQMLREEALKVFEVWLRDPDRRRY